MLRHKSTGCAAASATLLLGLHSAIAASYVQTDLASDIPGLAANTDSSMKNPWGMSFSPTSPIWMSDQGAGVATLHTGNGTQAALVVTIPGSTNPPTGPTGTVFNGTSSFQLPNSQPALFLSRRLTAKSQGGTAAARP